VSPIGATRALRALLQLMLGVVVVAVLVFFAGPPVARVLGHDVFAVRSGSMAPAIGIGALVVVERSGTSTVAVRDVVSVRLRNDIVLTHRVTAIQDEGGMRYLRTKGDANADVDPWTTREGDVLGPVRLSVPYAGFILALLSLPIGLAVLFSIVSSLLTALWLLEEADDEPDEPRIARGLREAGALRDSGPLRETGTLRRGDVTR
jgi:signal peptidase I